MYQGLSASSAGLELGLAVIIGLLIGMWLDKQLGTEPWLMLLFLVFGLVAGFRNVLRAASRAEKADL
jgi:ATP synthase protein I